MQRCEESAGKYRVTLEVFRAKEPVRVQIMGHADLVSYRDPNNPRYEDRHVVEAAPTVGTEEPFEGELCVHELAFLNGEPGKDFNLLYDFTVEELA